MTSYKIKRWDTIISSDGKTQTPVVYIHPDKSFIEFSRLNKNVLLCDISGTSMIYDNNIPGVVDISCSLINRPTLCNKHNLCAILLWSSWFGYPKCDSLGDVVFKGTTELHSCDGIFTS